MARLNAFLYQIGAEDSKRCKCGHLVEDVKHFLFRYKQWTEERRTMYERTEIQRGNLSFFLGGKSSTDPERWTPNMAAVRATITFAKATRRLEQGE